MNITSLRSAVIIFISVNAFIWLQIFSGASNTTTELYFIDVGQGDAQLVILPNNVKLLIDGGPQNNLLGELDKILPATDRYIDILLLSHPQTDHFNGFIELLKRYQVGIFISNGRQGESSNWRELESALKQSDVPTLTVERGDVIRYQNTRADIIAPSPQNHSSNELNDTSMIVKLVTEGITTLFTGDIGINTEKELTQVTNIKTDILKVAHHGSKYSSSPAFLAAAAPTLAIIEVGKNSYGHPTSEAIERIKNVGAKLLRTDEQGTIKLVLQNGTVQILTQPTNDKIPGL